MTGIAAVQAFSREAACRLVDISARQLQSWERQKLVPASERYGFKELLALRTLAKLKHSRVPAAQIRRALAALTRKLEGVHDPLTQLRIYADGRKIRVEAEGRAMDAESGQLLLNFDSVELERLVEFRAPEKARSERDRRAWAEHWFHKGLELEQAGAPAEQVIGAYQKALECDPQSAGALVNLGTLHFHARNWEQAERYYKQALIADPNYALAHFDLANLFDERGDRDQAFAHYHAALHASPRYADAHYNLALMYQGSNQPLKAVHHWNEYLKLDPSSQWAAIARKELTKLRASTVVPGLRRRPSPQNRPS